MLRKLLRLLAVVSALGAAGLIALVLAVFIQYRRNDHPLVLPRPRGPHPWIGQTPCAIAS